MNTQEWAEAIFGRKAAGDYLVGFYLPGQRSRSFSSTEDLALWPGVLTGYNLYVGTCLYGRAMDAKERGTKADVVAMPALWADIDIAGSAHAAKKAYPPDYDAALALVRALPKPPSIIVDSGHGIHAWWPLPQPLRVTDSPSRLRAQRLIADWQAMIGEVAQARGGWQIDATHDLTRVLRIPGSVNTKGGEQREVRVLWPT